MGKTNGGRFTFSAYANSVGAVAEKPLKAFLSDVPCAALPVNGGLISQSSENIEFRIGSARILSIGRASSTVLGEFREDHYVSLATATVEKLNILDVITADAVVSRVTSVYRTGQDVKPDMYPATFYLAGSHFDNLRIDGELIQCEVEPTFKSKEGFQIRRDEAHTDHLFKNCRERTDYLFKDRQEGFIPEFGAIHLGEVEKYGGKIILTMLRVELGCPVVATVTTGSTSTNGRDG